MNIKSATAAFFKAHGNGRVDSNGNDRLRLHDALHTLLDCPETYKNEFIVAIYQAVLMDTPYVGVGYKQTGAIAPQKVSFDDILQTVLPGVEQFLVGIEQKFGFTVTRDERMEPEEARYFFEDALAVKQVLEDRYGCAFRDVMADTFLSEDFAEFKNLFFPRAGEGHTAEPIGQDLH